MHKLIGTAKAEGRELFTVPEANRFKLLDEKAAKIREHLIEHVDSRLELLAELQGTTEASK
jgi:hypothetical protein